MVDDRTLNWMGFDKKRLEIRVEIVDYIARKGFYRKLYIQSSFSSFNTNKSGVRAD